MLEKINNVDKFQREKQVCGSAFIFADPDPAGFFLMRIRIRIHLLSELGSGSVFKNFSKNYLM